MYKPALNLYVRPAHRSKIPRVAGMVRGLLNSYEGYRSVSGLTDAHFASSKYVRLRFSSVGHAQSFKKLADAALGRYVEVRRVVVRS